MWRLWNKIFGVDYVQYSRFILRVEVLPNEELVGWINGIAIKITDPTEFIWLTCNQDKYFKI